MAQHIDSLKLLDWQHDHWVQYAYEQRREQPLTLEVNMIGTFRVKHGADTIYLGVSRGEAVTAYNDA